jgi:DNA-binding NtrC family response regulator
LRNHLEKKLIYSSFGEKIQPAVNDSPLTPAREETVTPLETVIRDHVLEAMKRFSFNKTKAAQALGISLSTLKRKLKSWDIEIEKSFRDRES